MEIVVLIVGLLLCSILPMVFIQHTSILVKKVGALHEILSNPQPSPTINIDLSDIQKRIDQLPLKVNQSITASASHHKGNLGELIAYIQLNSQYDRVLPIGDIIDFIGIRFPTETDPGTIDYIDVKNGPSAGLNKNQKVFRKLVETTKPQFIVTTLSTEIT